MHKNPIRFVLFATLFFLSCKPNVKVFKEEKILGIDVSSHQGIINWAEVKKARIEFCFIKATEGGDFIDKKFKENLIQARNNKILVGAYHYYRVKKSNDLQFKNFTSVVSKEAIDLPPVIDVEYFSNNSLHEKTNRDKFISNLKEFQSMLEMHYGKKPIIYTDIKFYNELIKGNIDNPLWLSDLHTKNLNYLDSTQWLFWQYNIVGKIKGIDSTVDLNMFNGNLEKLKNLKFSKSR